MAHMSDSLSNLDFHIGLTLGESGRTIPLYHYTDMGGLVGIVQNGLRVTHYSAMNDTKEISYGLSLANEILKEEIEKAPVIGKIALESIWPHGIQTDDSRSYIFCISKSPSNNLMWTSYADNHRGCVIQLALSDPDIFPVIYQPEEQDRLIRDMIHQITTHVEGIFDSAYMEPNDYKTRTTWLKRHKLDSASTHNCRTNMGLRALCMKAQSFEGEQEFRIAPPPDKTGVRFRARSGAVVPYISIPKTGWNVLHCKGFIKKVIVGQNAHPNCERQIKLLLESAAMGAVPVERNCSNVYPA